MTEWSSSAFSRRSTDHTCQSGIDFAIAWASSRMEPAPADVPGSRTNTFLALFEPTWSTLNWLYFSGPGPVMPFTVTTRSAAWELLVASVVSVDFDDPPDELHAANATSATTVASALAARTTRGRFISQIPQLHDCRSPG